MYDEQQNKNTQYCPGIHSTVYTVETIFMYTVQYVKYEAEKRTCVSRSGGGGGVGGESGGGGWGGGMRKPIRKIWE